ncbi:hypothetical protein F503_00131 [Ophiostoma piceae UAMH 11346]|uniref:Uncharacterized protein n=1 Tax=Ophiostoma piceae (strain UAMH 11346) TaxID=1262450 RepID=S3BWR0_OPHP1|nr:hypothetical protein F503_00131 [Ophiostoma piceae UAMH 11346]
MRAPKGKRQQKKERATGATEGEDRAEDEDKGRRQAKTKDRRQANKDRRQGQETTRGDEKDSGVVSTGQLEGVAPRTSPAGSLVPGPWAGDKDRDLLRTNQNGGSGGENGFRGRSE